MASSSEFLHKLLQQLHDGIQENELESMLNEWENKLNSNETKTCPHIRELSKNISERLQQNTLSDRALNLIIQTTHDLSSSLSLQELFTKIVSRARNLVGANVAWLTIFDEKEKLFRTPTIEGHFCIPSTKMTANVEFGVVNKVMYSKKFFETTDYINDQRFKHSPDLDEVMLSEGITSLAGFPIISGDDVQGLLFIAERYCRQLNEREKSLLGTFAQYAGVAMRNAHTFELLRHSLAEEERSRANLLQHIHSIEKSAHEHDEMTSLLANGAELKTFIQRMANLVKGAVLLLDETLQVREEFCSSTYQGLNAEKIKKGGIPPSILFPAIHQSQRIGRSVNLLEGEEEHCRVIALHDGSQHSESLFICYQGDLAAMDIRNIERCAVALSIAKLWNDRRETEKMIASSTLLRHLLLVSEPNLQTLSSVSDRLNLQGQEEVILALITIEGLDRTSQAVFIREKTLSLSLLIDQIDDAYVAIGSSEQINKLVSTLSKEKKNFTAGGILSSPFKLSQTTPIEYTRLQQSLPIIQKMQTSNSFHKQSEINLFAKLFESGDTKRLSNYMMQQLASITERDPKNRTKLKHTLLCFFDCQHNIVRTADSLGVHVNTVRQRLDILRDVTGGWDDPIKALELHVSLRLDALSSKK